MKSALKWKLAPLLLIAACAVSCSGGATPPRDPLVVDDVSRLNAVHVAEVARPERVDELKALLRRARDENLKVSIAGTKHSQGGHIATEDALFIDMTSFDDIIEVDAANMLVTVEAGATWDEVQRAVQPFGLAVKVMQSSNIFSVGGTLSCNAHGRDPSYGPISETVRAFRLLTADAEIVEVTRDEEPELFRAALGGYGLFGVILEVDLELTRDVMYEREIRVMDYTEYPGYFHDAIEGHPEVGLHSGRLSMAPGKGFLKDAYARTYRVTSGEPTSALRGEANVGRDRYFFGLSRRYDWGKRLRWCLQQALGDRAGEVRRISRNNAMRPPIAFLQYHSEDDTDILQEYFVPVDSFVPFVDSLRVILRNHDVNLLHLAIRYVPENHDILLSYASRPMFALVMYMNVGLSEAELAHARDWTRSLVDLALSRGGTYYLPYQGFPSREQLRRGYPGLDEFIAAKQTLDPETRFSNQFFERYIAAVESVAAGH